MASSSGTEDSKSPAGSTPGFFSSFDSKKPEKSEDKSPTPAASKSSISPPPSFPESEKRDVNHTSLSPIPSHSRALIDQGGPAMAYLQQSMASSPTYPATIPTFPPRLTVRSATSLLTGLVTVEAGPMVSILKLTGRTVFLAGSESGELIGEGTAESMLRHTGVLMLEGFSTEISTQNEAWFFSAPATTTGAMALEWRRSSKEGTEKKSSDLLNTTIFLVPKGAPEDVEALVTWEPTGAHIRSKGDIGDFIFHGPTLTGELGNAFNMVVVMSMIKIYFMNYEVKMEWSYLGAVDTPGGSS